MAMLSEDAEAFSQALLDIWPDIRFTDYDVGYETILHEDGYLYDRPKKILRYYSSLAAEDPFHFHVWREPEDWTPDWIGPINDHYRLANPPRLSFVYNRSKCWAPRTWNIRSGRIWAYYLKSDKEHLSFLNKVIRLTGKLTSNFVELWNRKTGELVDPGYRSELWVGHHTADWCRADPERRIDGSWRPGDEPSPGE